MNGYSIVSRKLVQITTILATLLITSCATITMDKKNTASEKYPKIPEMLDGKGIFILDKKMAANLKVKSIKFSDWLFQESGGLKNRNRFGQSEYNKHGKILLFSGHRDQVGRIKTEFLYSNNNLSTKKLNIIVKGKPKLISKKTFIYIDGKQSEATAFNESGEIKAKNKFLYNEDGNNVEIQYQDKNGGYIASIKNKFDKFGNILEEKGGGKTILYSYDNHTITIFNLVGDEKLHSKIEYVFDSKWNLSSYTRASGDGNYWDKFTYKYNNNLLPIEKVWSRKEFIVQDPYQLTKYSYQYY